MPIMESSKSFDQFECSQIVLLYFHANNCNQSNFRWKICTKVCVCVCVGTDCADLNSIRFKRCIICNRNSRFVAITERKSHKNTVEPKF